MLSQVLTDQDRQSPCPHGPDSLVGETDYKQGSKHINRMLSDWEKCCDKNKMGNVVVTRYEVRLLQLGQTRKACMGRQGWTRDLKEGRKGTMQRSRVCAPQVKGTAYAKILRSKAAWCVQ